MLNFLITEKRLSEFQLKILMGEDYDVTTNDSHCTQVYDYFFYPVETKDISLITQLPAKNFNDCIVMSKDYADGLGWTAYVAENSVWYECSLNINHALLDAMASAVA